ncbi:MAG: N-acetylneuraminate synthase family protein [Sulfuriferula sp.]
MSAIIPAPLFVLEMANNHMGDVEHGLSVIRAFGEVCRDFPFRFAFKLQYRDLDTFIHPAAQGRDDIKYVKRFSETRLSRQDFDRLIAAMREAGFLTMATPFDEPSVDVIEAQDLDFIKIASCSFTDWPLLERIARADKPIIASTAGADLEDIDRVLSYFEHRGKSISVMHCVGEYPTPPAHLQLNQIELFKRRYPHVPIGYSTHESPDNCEAIQMAIAKGAVIFEKHVGVPTAKWPLNNYSASPQQIAAWLQAAQRAYEMCGVPNGVRVEAAEAEIASLRSLRRGVFAKHPIKAGEMVTDADVFMAFPPQENQVTANDWSKFAKFVATQDIAENAALTDVNARCDDTREKIAEIIQRVKILLQEGHVIVPANTDLEISHHYGLEQFDAYGLALITVVNREYCKKLIVMLPGQTHPEQYHLKKEETFHILHGEIHMALDGDEKIYNPGEVVMVGRGVRHMFYSPLGAVFEEISSTHHKDDSYYTDVAIQNNKNRKTLLPHWMK